MKYMIILGVSKKTDGNIDDIVVIDSSPDEKQRIMDYDDDNDKVVVATEVSLSSVAHHGNEVDEITAIESYSTPTEFGDIASSPLESSEVAGEYVLFSSDVVDYVDSDDSQKTNIKQQMILSEDDKTMHLINIDLPGIEDNKIFQNNSSEDERENNRVKENLSFRDTHKSDHHYASNHHKDIMTITDIIVPKENLNKTSKLNDSNIATTEDFEAMIDCGNKKTVKSTKNGSGGESKSTITSHANQSGNVIKSDSKIITIITTQNSQFANKVNPIMSYAARIPISAAMITSRPNITNFTTHKKLLKDGTQTTAKVSIGNQTISVPVLKTVPLISGTTNQAKSTSDNTKVNISKSTPTIINMTQQKIPTSSIITLSAYNFTQPPFVQGSSQTTITPVRVTASESLMDKFSPKSSQSINYTKLSSLTVTQDVSLPTKIFEDESISPDSSIEHDDHDLLSLEKHDLRSERDADNSENENQNEININENSSTSDKDKSILTMHVTPRSRESSISPVQASTSQQHQRLATSMPQLSPLSQPTEMTTNMANVSQQLRSIMSSLSSQIKHPTDTNKTEVTCQNFNLEIIKSDELPKQPTQMHQLSSEKSDKFVLQAKSNQCSQSISLPSPTITTSSFSTPSSLSTALTSSSISTSTPSTNILLVQQIRPMTSSNSVKVQSSQIIGHPQNQSIFITSQMPNLAKIQPDLKSNIIMTSSNGSSNIILSTSSALSSISHPPALIVTTTNRSGVISMPSGTQVKGSGSILSATLSQPSNKFNTLLQTQLSNAPFRRSKSTDEVPISIKPTPAQIMGNKRHSLEASIVKDIVTEEAPDIGLCFFIIDNLNFIINSKQN